MILYAVDGIFVSSECIISYNQFHLSQDQDLSLSKLIIARMCMESCLDIELVFPIELIHDGL